MFNNRLSRFSSQPLPSAQLPPAQLPSALHTSAASLATTTRAAPTKLGSPLRVSSAAPLPSPAPVSSAVLLRGHKTVDIAHNGMLYTLQATKLGKLILTK